MSRRWQIGDRVLRPVFGPREVARWGQRWQLGVVEIVRRHGKVIVSSYGWMYEHRVDELRSPDHPSE